MTDRPISTSYGSDRGIPADRHYIEEFLRTHADAIRGRCLEIHHDQYVTRFGGRAVEKVDVLDIDPNNERATLIGDLQRLGSVVASDHYNCVVVTQTLQYLPQPHLGVGELYRILAPGGTLLVTVPCLSRTEPGHDDVDFWRFMPSGARLLFSEAPWSDVEVTAFGNTLVGMAIWEGLAVEDLPSRAWRRHDADWPCVVGVRATK
jgi:SAM-dependent methyltransferase